MAINLIYRLNSNPNVPNGNITANGPLTMEQIDGNMKSISNGFDDVDKQFTQVEVALANKADINNPSFNGYIKIPASATASLPVKVPNGTVVYDLNRKALVIWVDDKWQVISTDSGLVGFVSKQGDIMSGKLTGTTADFKEGMKTLPPGAEIGTETDTVATVQWTETTIRDAIDARIGTTTNEVITDKITANNQIIIEGVEDGNGLILQAGDALFETGNLTVSKGDVNIAEGDLYVNTVYASVLRGDIDLGTLPEPK